MPSTKKSQTDELTRQILEVVIRIPYGTVISYGQVAKMAGLPKHARLVGYILKHLDAENDLPWHRVVNAKGQISLGKINNQGQNIQQLKLMAEGVAFFNEKIDFKKFGWMQ